MSHLPWRTSNLVGRVGSGACHRMPHPPVSSPESVSSLHEGPRMAPAGRGEVSLWPRSAHTTFRGCGPRPPGDECSHLPCVRVSHRHNGHTRGGQLSLCAGNARVGGGIFVAAGCVCWLPERKGQAAPESAAFCRDRSHCHDCDRPCCSDGAERLAAPPPRTPAARGQPGARGCCWPFRCSLCASLSPRVPRVSRPGVWIPSPRIRTLCCRGLAVADAQV